VAYIVPSDISQLALSGGHSMELDTLADLKKSLPADYTVFHGVHWARDYAGGTSFGEIDFVVVNRSGEVLFIEQKNGPLEERDGGLVKVYSGSPKDVGEQIHRSINKVRDKFRWRHDRSVPFEVSYLIYCPDYRVVNVNAVGLDGDRVVDGSTRDELTSRIEKLLGPGNPNDEAHRKLIDGFFRQTFEVVPDIHAHISAHETHFTRMRGGMLSLVRGLVISPFRLWIDGVAGSGKSAVGRHYFDLALEQGRHPLFVCFNRPLAERVKRATGSGGYVDTFHGLCASFLEERGQTIDYSQMTNDPDFWLGIQERVVDEPKPDSWLFDTLVVDEGQDFEPLWYDVLHSFLRDDAAILWLQDPEQNIRQQEGVVLPSDFVGYRSLTNHRSPDAIARFIMRNLDVEFECGNDLPGLGVGIFSYNDSEEQAGIVAGIVRDHLKRGFSYEDIVVVSLRGIKSAFFDGLENVGAYTAKRFTGEYDNLGNQVMSDGVLTLETIYRFKGQQAPAVILVDVDPDPTKRSQSTRLLNAAMTRATVRLDIVMRNGNEMTKDFIL
jgi:hypothetical protein